MRSQKKKPGPWKVLIAIALGILIGSCTQQGSSLWGFPLFELLHPVYQLCGKIFINALTLIVVPLVAASIITGIARIGGDSNFGRLGGKIFGFYLGTNLIAILVGLFFVNVFNPGSGISLDNASALQPSAAQALTSQGTPVLSDLFFQIVPANIFDAFSKGQMLGVIFFSLLFGYSLSRIDGKNAASLMSCFQGIFEAMIKLTHLIMKFLPVGVFFLVAQVFAESGLKSLGSLGLFTLTVLVGLAAFMGLALPALIKGFGNLSPRRHFRAMGPALITAFSTSSSAATLPITIDCVEKRAGVSNKICSLVIPLGTSINMSGSALYECVAALFVAQAYGLDLSLATQFMVVLLSLVMSIGVAGVPSGSLVAIIAILKVMGLPIEGIGLFIAVDRVLDMCRTTVNVFSDSCCAVLVAKTEGESGVLAKNDP
jgi:proton glutamate symport protein